MPTQAKTVARRPGPTPSAATRGRSRFLLAAAALVGLLASGATSIALAQAAPSYEQKKAICRQEGEFTQGLTGDELISFVAQCTSQSAGTSTPTAAAGDAYEAKRQACRTEGADRQGLSGDFLQAYVAKCVGE